MQDNRLNIVIKSFPALNGDCILVSFGDNYKKHILIDCGYTDTYKKYLKKELLEIANKKECIEKLIITHIDSDHILGAISLLKENLNRFIEIKEVWHNTYRHIQSVKIETSAKPNQLIGFKQVIARGYCLEKSNNLELEISAEQGTTVGALLIKGKYNWNLAFDGQAVSIDNQQDIIIDEKTRILLLSPDYRKLKILESFWEEELDKLNLERTKGYDNYFDDAFEMMLSWEKEKVKIFEKEISSTNISIEELSKAEFSEDESATNGSSIAFILQIKDKNLLFLGDSHPDLILKSLKNYQNENSIYFDFIKVSHHGSFNNTSPSLLQLIDSRIYLFSTNGSRHNHPDKETIAHIICRKTNFQRQLFFNYKTPNSEYYNNKDWMNKYNYSINYIEEHPYEIPLT